LRPTETGAAFVRGTNFLFELNVEKALLEKSDQSTGGDLSAIDCGKVCLRFGIESVEGMVKAAFLEVPLDQEIDLVA
jgi:hypothetical protein